MSAAGPLNVTCRKGYRLANSLVLKSVLNVLTIIFCVIAHPDSSLPIINQPPGFTFIQA